MSTIEVDCGSGNDYDGRMGVRISSIFVIGFGSLAGMVLHGVTTTMHGTDDTQVRSCLLLLRGVNA